MLCQQSRAILKTMKILKFLAIGIGLFAAILLLLLYEGDIPVDVVDAKYGSPSSQFMTLENGTRIHYRDEGNRHGVPIVLIHGFGASLHTWTSWVEFLGDDYRVITLDLPAHGLTGAAPDGDYSTHAYVGAIKNVVDHLKLTTFSMGGNSMGGDVAWHFALAYPDALDNMILVNATGLNSWKNEANKPLIFDLLANDWFRSIASMLDPYYLIEQAVQTAYNHTDVVTDDLILRYYHMAMRKGSREAIITRSSTQASTQESAVATAEQLSSIQTPTLVMWGRNDALIDVSVAHLFEATLPNVTLIIYDEVGHVPMEEIPERSAADVKDFLQRTR